MTDTKRSTSDPWERVTLDGLTAAIRGDEALRSHIEWETFDQDVACWLRGVGWILSPSERESFHLAAMQGAASGAVPLVWSRAGAADVYPDFVVSGAEAAAHRIATANRESGFEHLSEAAKSAAASFDVDAIAALWRTLLGL